MKLHRKNQPDFVSSSALKHRKLNPNEMPMQEPMPKMKKMAMGGEAEAPHGIDEIKPDKGFGKIIIMKAEGGEIEPQDEEQEESEDQHSSLAAAIMARRRPMAEGGQVDIDSNEEVIPSAFHERNEAAMKENYDTDISQPTDSNEHSEEIESDENDRISAIRNRLISKRISGQK